MCGVGGGRSVLNTHSVSRLLRDGVYDVALEVGVVVILDKRAY